jgi:cytochrome c
MYKPALSTENLLRSNNCLACHAVDRKLVGPSFNDIAAKYKGKDTSVKYLTGRIKNGGSGVWGAIPMPAQRQLSDADAEAMAKWILR